MKRNPHSEARRKTGRVNYRFLRPLAAFPLSVLLLLAVPGVTRAAFIQAASLALADVQAAVNSAQNGDTVVLPAGTTNWANYCGVTNKSITIKGAGTGLTVITNTQLSNRNVGVGNVIILSLATNRFARVTGLSFDGNYTANGIYICGSEGGAFQVDHCSFANFYSVGIMPCELGPGLINACTFIDNYNDIEVTPTTSQNNSWAEPLSLGTTNCVDVENCTFLYYTWSPIKQISTFSQGNGARTVFRYNTWTNFNTNLSFFPIADAHGNMLPVSNSVTGLTPSTTVGTNYGSGRGTRQFELYNNLFVAVANTTTRLVHLRGGTCLVYSNIYIGRYMTQSFYMQEEDGPSRWTNLVTYQGYDPHWLNIWSNTVNGVLCESNAFAAPSDAPFILAGTNLFWSPTPLANPEITNYTPLVYPHPLVTAENSVSPPTNLRVVGTTP
jgi:hypothetical protein